MLITLRRLSRFGLPALLTGTICAGILLGFNVTYINSAAVQEMNRQSVEADGGRIVAARSLGWPFIIKGQLEIVVNDPAALDEWTPSEQSETATDGSQLWRLPNGIMRIDNKRVFIESESPRPPGYRWRIVLNGIIGASIALATLLLTELLTRRKHR